VDEEYGIPFLASTPSQSNQAVLDAWSPVHGLVGVVSGVWGINPWLFLVLAVSYEWWEHLKEYPKGNAFFGTGESEWRANLVMDVGLNCAGYAIGAWLRARNIPTSEIGPEPGPFGT